MIQVIVSGHGQFASGLCSGAALLVGESEGYHAVDFIEGMTPEALREALSARVALAEANPVLFLTDILGGTPFRECATLAASLADAEVVSGSNLQMLVEASMEREDASSATELAQVLVESAKSCMTLLSSAQQERAQQMDANEEDDGI